MLEIIGLYDDSEGQPQWARDSNSIEYYGLYYRDPDTGLAEHLLDFN